MGLPMRWSLDWEKDGLGFAETVNINPGMRLDVSQQDDDDEQQEVSFSSAFSSIEETLTQTDLSGTCGQVVISHGMNQPCYMM